MTQKIFEADDKALSSVMSFVESELEEAGANMKSLMQVCVAVEEIFVNVAHYAYPGKNGDVSLSIDVEGSVATLVFTDSGIPFNPLEKADPDITLSAEDRSIGGLGIFMVKKSMDEVRYERKDESNVFTMIKEIK